MNSPKPLHLLLGSFFALTAVLLGAMGAHALKGVLGAEQLASFETAVRYQMYHALVLVGIALKGHSVHLRYERVVTVLFSVGITLFSGSIYILSLKEHLGLNVSWMGPVTPLGGLVLIAAWALMLMDAVRLIYRKER